MMKIQLVIFDFDGTLGDTRSTIVATMQQTITELNLSEKSDEECAATIGLPLKNCFVQLFPQLSEEETEQCAAVYRRIFEANKLLYKPVLFPHVKETLIWLHEHNIKMTVASSRSTLSLHDLLESLGIAGYFDYILGAEDVANPKPDPEPVLKTLEKMGVDAAQTLVVGDMAVDILMGARAGCETCGVTFGNGTYEELTHSGVGFIINDMAELVGVVGE
ncbi:MAG: HAD family hydrolase [Bacteroidales bacterium]|nr:HAD family hydrolase [Bacteroidales bacterium]